MDNHKVIGGSGFISSNAIISPNSLIAPSVRIYGPAVIKAHVILDSNVIIGYPSPVEQSQLKSHLRTGGSFIHGSFDDLLDSFVSTETVIEEGVIIRSGTVIYSGSHIDENADLAHNIMVRENCMIGRDTNVITGAQIMSTVHIGHGCRIAGTLCNRTRVGDCTSMLGHAMHRYKVGVPGLIEPSPKIGNGVIVGREVAIVGDVEIGNFSIVGAGAVVTKSIPSFTIWVGNPAVQVRTRNLEECQELYRKVKSYEGR